MVVGATAGVVAPCLRGPIPPGALDPPGSLPSEPAGRLGGLGARKRGAGREAQVPGRDGGRAWVFGDRSYKDRPNFGRARLL